MCAALHPSSSVKLGTLFPVLRSRLICITSRNISLVHTGAQRRLSVKHYCSSPYAGMAMWEVWRACSPPNTLLFPVRRRHSLRRTGKGDSAEAQPPQNPSTAYGELVKLPLYSDRWAQATKDEKEPVRMS